MFTLNLDGILDSYELNTIYWAVLSNKTNLNAMDDVALDLMGRSDGNLSSISNIYSLLPKETNWNKTTACDKKCSDMKNDIQKQIFIKHALSSIHNVKLGTFLRQINVLSGSYIPCQHCPNIEKMTCLEIGNMNCNNGTVNLKSIMEKMKFAYYSATPEDVLKLQQKLSNANFTYKLSTIVNGDEEVIILESRLT